MENNKNNLSIISYLLFVGWIIAFAMYANKSNKTEFNKFHVRQSLGIHIISIAVWIVCAVIGYIPLLGGMVCNILWIAVCAMLIWGIIGAVNSKKNKIPFLGDMFQEYLKNIIN